MQGGVGSTVSLTSVACSKNTAGERSSNFACRSFARVTDTNGGCVSVGFGVPLRMNSVTCDHNLAGLSPFVAMFALQLVVFAQARMVQDRKSVV